MYLGNVFSNIVTIEGGTVNKNGDNSAVYGGRNAGGARGSVSANKVIITGGFVNTDVHGGYANGTGTVSGNSVTISGGTFSSGASATTKVYGGRSEGSGAVSGNSVTISGGTFNTGASATTNVYGGYSTNSSADVSANTVIINGGTVSAVNGGFINQSSGTGSASSNHVIIYGGTVGAVAGGKFAGGTAKDNIVDLGGYIEKGSVVTGDDWKATITGTLYGGEAISMGSGTSTGNAVNVFSVGNTVGKLATTSIQNLNFYIPASAMDAEGSNTMLTINDSSLTDLSALTIKAGVTNVGQVSKGSRITLINTPSSTFKTSGSYGTLTDGIMKVALKLYTTQEDGTEVAGASENAKNLLAEALADGNANGSDGQATEQAKSPVETQAAGVSLLNQGSDMLAVAGLDNAAEAAGQAGEAGSVSSMAPFAAMGGSNQRIHSGSYVDMKAWNINLGLAKEITNKYGKLLFGPMLEYGHGSYDSYLDDGTHGSGKSKFFGGGLFAKESYHDGLYVEGSLRAGRAKNDYRAIIADKDMSYDNSATYLAAHLGVGKEVELNEKDSLDYYGKLFYSHQNSSRATLKAGYTYDFDAVDSFRTRIGARYTHKLNDFNKIYAGLAWQHEFDSKCRATIHAGDWTNEAPAPSVKGDTGILELGWKVKPGKGNFETGLGFTGSVGKQEGIGFNASFQWNF